MVIDTFEIYGWETVYLGVNVLVQDLIQSIRTVNPDYLALSLTVPSNFSNFEKSIEAICAEYPDLPILIGGRAFSIIGVDSLMNIKNVKYFSDLYELESFLTS